MGTPVSNYVKNFFFGIISLVKNDFTSLNGGNVPIDMRRRVEFQALESSGNNINSRVLKNILSLLREFQGRTGNPDNLESPERM